MLNMKILLSFIISGIIVCVSAGDYIEVDLQKHLQNAKKLPRFWTNSGFAPPAPVQKVDEFFHSDDVKMNLEIIGSLPNRGISHMRIHWLLNLLKISNYTKFHIPVYDFESLDRFFGDLTSFGLHPNLEFMTTLKFKNQSEFHWEDFAFQVVNRYVEQFGVNVVKNWKFETWNEPDLKEYNLMNFEFSDYIEYIIGIEKGLRAVERLHQLPKTFLLRGPAGLFKNEDTHMFCWGLLEACDENPRNCPIDVISFHSKGQNGRKAEEILNGGQKLVERIMERYPMLGGKKYSNTEADPIKRWSEPRDFQSDIQYATMLTTTVLQHWRVIYDKTLADLDSISHDNSFLSYHPFEFEQRTLLARFQMNLTKPRTVQYVQKPVYSALGLLANLGELATNEIELKEQNLTMVVTRGLGGPAYYCSVIASNIDTGNYSESVRFVTIRLKNVKIQGNKRMRILVEGIDPTTNPARVYNNLRRPDFPNSKQFEAMRSVQDPVIWKSSEISRKQNDVVLKLKIRFPFVASLRICEDSGKKPLGVKNVRLRKIDAENLVIFWTDHYYKSRCIKTYEVYYKTLQRPSKWKHLTRNIHVPFMYRQFYSQNGFSGCFRIRAVDIFDRKGFFSKIVCLK